MATVSDEIYASMKQADAMLPKVIGSITAYADTIERAKQAIVNRHGFPQVSHDLESVMIFTDLDYVVCAMRQLVDEYDAMVTDQKEGRL